MAESTPEASRPSRRPRRPRRWLLDLVLIGGVFLAVRAYQAPRVSLDPLPALAGVTLDGELADISERGGRPLLVHFWASWCGVCKAQAPNIEEVAGGAEVLTVATQSGSPDAVRAYLEGKGLEFPVLNDPSGALAARFGVRAFPTTFIIDSAGKVSSTEVGYTTALGLRARLWWAGL